jgi:AraC family transcriptional regulator
MSPEINHIPEIKLIGKRMKMSYAENKTTELWKSFMPKRKEINNNVGTELYSMQIYPPLFFDNFNPNSEFEKWATVEVTDFDKVPDGMECFLLPSGLYAVFKYKGDGSNATKTFQYIFETWLPVSEYSLDNRPHFEKLEEKYKRGDPESEEDIWIPIKPKE